MSDTFRAWEAVLADMVEGRWLAMLAAADLAEEQGRDAEALGWRWLAGKKRWPQERKDGQSRWRWAFSRDLDSRSAMAHDLPRGTGPVDGPLEWVGRSERNAVCWAAEAVGKWLLAGCPEAPGGSRTSYQGTMQRIDLS